jgi:hypothetical protein
MLSRSYARLFALAFEFPCCGRYWPPAGQARLVLAALPRRARKR